MITLKKAILPPLPPRLPLPRSSLLDDRVFESHSGLTILSIDPGMDHYAIAVIDAKSLCLLDSATIVMKEWNDKAIEYDERICKILTYWVHAWKPILACIEHQFRGLPLISIEQCSVGCLITTGTKTRIVYPETIKRVFEENLGCHGHTDNKIRAEKFAHSLGYQGTDSHVSDAIIQALACIPKEI